MDRRISRVNKYAEGIRNGKIPACKMVKLAVERWYADWQREDLYFREEPFLRFCSMTAQMRHFKGEFAGQPIKLEDWQLFIAANILGWYRKDTRSRRYQYADVYVPRKNGKTTFATLYGQERCAAMIRELTRHACDSLKDVFPCPDFLIWLAEYMAERTT